MLRFVTVELEESSIEFKPVIDRRPVIPEPLPVKLVAVADVRMRTPPGVEPKLDAFYVGMLRFVRDEGSGLVYRADNFRLRFHHVDPLAMRDELRPVGIEVLSLSEAERLLLAAEMEYERLRGLVAGADTLLLRDPAGNWVSLSESAQLW